MRRAAFLPEEAVHLLVWFGSVPYGLVGDFPSNPSCKRCAKMSVNCYDGGDEALFKSVTYLHIKAMLQRLFRCSMTKKKHHFGNMSNWSCVMFLLSKCEHLLLFLWSVCEASGCKVKLGTMFCSIFLKKLVISIKQSCVTSECCLSNQRNVMPSVAQSCFRCCKMTPACQKLKQRSSINDI